MIYVLDYIHVHREQYTVSFLKQKSIVLQTSLGMLSCYLKITLRFSRQLFALFPQLDLQSPPLSTLSLAGLFLSNMPQLRSPGLSHNPSNKSLSSSIQLHGVSRLLGDLISPRG